MGKSVPGAVALVLTFVLFFPYIRSILRGQTRPHVLSWVIWSLGTLVVFFAQLKGGAGLGAWPIGVSGLITCYVACISWARRSDLSITIFDWVCLVVSLLAIPAWIISDSPLWAVAILTAIDLVGFGPTVRKACSRPHEERIWFYLLAGVRNALVVLALEHYSLTTVLFPAAVGVACVLLAIFIAARRWSVPKISRATASENP